MNNDIAQAMGGAAFVPSNVEGAGGAFSPIPVGWYPACIDKAKIRQTKAGTGAYVWMELSIVGEQFAGRKLFPMVHIQNPNEACVKIGRRNLADLGIACGLTSISGTDELIGKIISVKVKIRKEKDREPDNAVAGYRLVSAQSAPAPVLKHAKSVPAMMPASSGQGTAAPMPWEAK